METINLVHFYEIIKIVKHGFDGETAMVEAYTLMLIYIN